jgi:pimeloyl-ACP methyl ester carboxylesterase
MGQPLLSRLLDRLVLQPTQHPIPTNEKTRRFVPCGAGQLEVWTHRVGCVGGRQPDLYVLKFPGTAGRAERSTDHPADGWPGRGVELWAVNPPGYGGSTGRASLQHLSAVARTVYQALQQDAAGRPILVTGNSLGCASALYLAATVPLAGLVLRNPPPLREVILGRHSWWNLGVGTRLLVRHVPQELACVQNARRSTAPALFISSGSDTLIPPPYQRQVVEAYAGPRRVLLLPEADHATPMTADEETQYAELLAWLRETMDGR